MRRQHPFVRTWIVRFSALLVLAAATVASAGTPEPRRRTLFIILDAVPYHVAAEVTNPDLGEGALFKGLKGPIPVVSTYPTSTSVALPGLLAPFGIEPSPGYECRFFDWKRNKVRGGGPISYGRIRFPWREFFDLSRKGPVPSAFQGLHPIRSSIARIDEGIEAFLQTDKDPYWIYISETDLSAHLKGPEAIKRVFSFLDEKIRTVRKAHPERPFDVVIFSDHGIAGGMPLRNTWPAVRKALRQAGYRYTHRLKRPKDVVLSPLGLVSNFEVYTHDTIKAVVARILALVPGVDLCVYRDDRGWTIESKRGRARFERRSTPDGLQWRYLPVTGDPLGYVPLLEAYRGEHAASDDWLADEAWFRITASAHYPDALLRLARSFELVRNPATITCSLAPGYMFGAERTDFLCRLGNGPLRWTHGALYQEATLAFLMSDVKAWTPPEIGRFSTAFVPFAEALSRRPAPPPPPSPAASSR